MTDRGTSWRNQPATTSHGRWPRVDFPGSSHPGDAVRADAPTAVAALVTVDVTPLTGGPWDVQVSLPEEAEDLLGADAYASLEERFAAVPGVRRVVFEDRDLLVLSTDGLEPEELRRALNGVVPGLGRPDVA